MKEVKENFIALSLLTIINCVVLGDFISKGQWKHGVGYFIFFYTAVLLIYFFTKRIPPATDFLVKNPIKESGLAVLFAVAGGLFLTLNFY